MKLKTRTHPIETRCTPRARTFLRLYAGQPFFPGLVCELQNIAGVLSQFDIERAVLAAKDKNRRNY